MTMIRTHLLDEIKLLRSHGFTQQEIGTRIGISRQVVAYWLAKLKKTYLEEEGSR